MSHGVTGQLTPVNEEGPAPCARTGMPLWPIKEGRTEYEGYKGSEGDPGRENQNQSEKGK